MRFCMVRMVKRVRHPHTAVKHKNRTEGLSDSPRLSGFGLQPDTSRSREPWRLVADGGKPSHLLLP